MWQHALATLWHDPAARSHVEAALRLAAAHYEQAPSGACYNPDLDESP